MGLRGQWALGTMTTDFRRGLSPASIPRLRWRCFPSLFGGRQRRDFALDLGDLSGKSLTLMGMSTLLTDQVKTSEALGCGSPPGPVGFDMDGNDVVLALRFDSSMSGARARLPTTPIGPAQTSPSSIALCSTPRWHSNAMGAPSALAIGVPSTGCRWRHSNTISSPMASFLRPRPGTRPRGRSVFQSCTMAIPPPTLRGSRRTPPSCGTMSKPSCSQAIFALPASSP